MNNYVDQNSIELLMKEIQKSINEDNYLSALTMALIIPDALGKVAFPKLKDKSEERYIRWFDENVRDLFGRLYSQPFFEGDAIRMSGVVCYKMRCKLLHEGENDLKDKTGIDEFVLSFDKEGFVRGDYAGRDYDFRKYDPKTGECPKTDYLYVSCKGLSLEIVAAAKKFISDNPNLKYPTIRVNSGGGKTNNDFFIK